jgi:1-deoxy-D-xylulose-5-phosphate synthase
VHGLKKGLKDMVLSPQGMFEDLGLKYVGPVDGHDIEQSVESRAAQGAVLRRAGHRPRHHQEGQGLSGTLAPTKPTASTPSTGSTPKPVSRCRSRAGSGPTSSVTRSSSGTARPDVVAITAAMLIPVGLEEFARRFPDRVFDVGIAEQHAFTMAAGLAYAGLHPVVCVYATFLNRAFDQLLMDCACTGAGVTVILDRAVSPAPTGPRTTACGT